MTFTIFLGTLGGAMAIGVPIAFALLVTGSALMLFSGEFDATLLSQKIVEGADSFPLLAIPFFMLAGELMNAGGISRRIVDFALAWIGHIRGGLGIVAIVAAVIMAAISGSAAADAAALTAMLIPMMRKAGYDVSRAGGLIAAGSVIAPVLPPSIALIVFGVIANVSIGKLFMAAIVPGLLMGLALLITWLWISRKEPGRVQERMPMRERLRVTGRAVWALIMPIGIVGGMKLGIFTPTEAAVVAAVYAFLIGMFVYGELRWSMVYPLLLTAAKVSATVVFLIATALVSAWLITVSEIPQQVSDMLQPLIANPTLLMFAMMALVIVVGTALDFSPTLLILTPILMPIVREAGIDPVYFGVLFVMNNAIGLITPPVGIVLNVVCSGARVTMGQLMKGLWPFLIAELAVLFLLVLFPSIVLVPLRWLF
jgi:tripartite ATP-independent transporter DctM subunit